MEHDATWCNGFEEQSPKFFEVSSVSAISSASGLIRLAVTALAEMLASRMASTSMRTLKVFDVCGESNGS